MKTYDDADRVVGVRMANIFIGLSQISDELTTLGNLSSEYKEFIPAELNDFKLDFYKLLSGTKLFDLVAKENSTLKNSIVSVLCEEIDENQEMIFHFQDCQMKAEQHRQFFDNFCSFASSMKCDTTLQSSNVLKPLQNAQNVTKK